MSLIVGKDSAGTNKTLQTKDDGTYDRLTVDGLMTFGGPTSTIEYQTVSGVSASTLTTVLSFTNSTGANIFIQGIGGTGDSARCLWVIEINSTEVLRRRTSTAYPFLEIPLYGFKLANTDVVDVKVEHYAGVTRSFQVDMRYST